MITFKYTDEQDDFDDVVVEVGTRAEHIQGVMEAFRRFMLHVGHSPSNIDRIVFEEKQQGLPTQMDMFK